MAAKAAPAAGPNQAGLGQRLPWYILPQRSALSLLLEEVLKLAHLFLILETSFFAMHGMIERGLQRIFTTSLKNVAYQSGSVRKMLF